MRVRNIKNPRIVDSSRLERARSLGNKAAMRLQALSLPETASDEYKNACIEAYNKTAERIRAEGCPYYYVGLDFRNNLQHKQYQAQREYFSSAEEFLNSKFEERKKVLELAGVSEKDISDYKRGLFEIPKKRLAKSNSENKSKTTKSHSKKRNFDAIAQGGELEATLAPVKRARTAETPETEIATLLATMEQIEIPSDQASVRSVTDVQPFAPLPTIPLFAQIVFEAESIFPEFIHDSTSYFPKFFGQRQAAASYFPTFFGQRQAAAPQASSSEPMRALSTSRGNVK